MTFVASSKVDLSSAASHSDPELAALIVESALEYAIFTPAPEGPDHDLESRAKRILDDDAEAAEFSDLVLVHRTGLGCRRGPPRN